jgi:hypothetical protein
MGFLKIFGKANTEFNEAADLFKSLSQYSVTSTEYQMILRDIFDKCQHAITSDNRDGDSHILLANAYYLVYTVNHLVISQTLPLKLSAATIQHWIASPIVNYPWTKNKENGRKVYEMVTQDVALLVQNSSLDIVMRSFESEFYDRAITEVPEIDEYARSMPSTEKDWIPSDAPEVLRRVIESVYLAMIRGADLEQIRKIMQEASSGTPPEITASMIEDVRNHYDDDWTDHSIIGTHVAAELDIPFTNDWSKLSLAIIYHFKRGLSGGTIKMKALTAQLAFGNSDSLQKESLITFIDRYIQELAGWLPRKPTRLPYSRRTNL